MLEGGAAKSLEPGSAHGQRLVAVTTTRGVAAGRNDGRFTVNEEQRNVMGSGRGFIAALDQSGGSSPKALKLYGIPEDSWSGDDEMFDLIHQMRARIIKSPAFNGDRILGAILFEQTMDRQIDGLDSGDYLWSK